jgi:hypothetical protein
MVCFNGLKTLSEKALSLKKINLQDYWESYVPTQTLEINLK